jgi:transcriptional regulator with XRE-family HTH domain
VTSFATLLKQGRARAGFSQKELAQQIGVDKSYISRIERGTSPPPVRDKVLSMIQALGISESEERLAFLMAAGYFVEEDYKAALIDMGVAPEDPGDHFIPRGKYPYQQLLFIGHVKEQSLIRKLQLVLSLARNAEDTEDDVIQLIESFFDWLAFKFNSGKVRKDQT